MANERKFTFNFNDDIRSNNLRQSWESQSLDIFGVDFIYMPVSNFDIDEVPLLYKEFRNKNFNRAYQMRFILEDASMFFQGDRDMFSKFGLQIDDELIVWIPRLEYHERITGIKYDFSQGTSTDGAFKIDIVKPYIGDLLYSEQYRSLFQVTYAEDQEIFSNGYTECYKLTCTKYETDGNENIDISSTGMGNEMETGGQSNDFEDLINIINNIDDEARDSKTNIIVDPNETGFDADDTEIENDDFIDESNDQSEDYDIDRNDPFSQWF